MLLCTVPVIWIVTFHIDGNATSTSDCGTRNVIQSRTLSVTTGKERKGEMRERATMWHYHIESNLYPHCIHWHGIDVLNALMLCYDSITHPFPHASATTYYGDDIVGIAGEGWGVRTLPSPHCTSQRTHTGGRRFNFRGAGTEKRTCAIQTLMSLREDLGVNCVVPLTKSKRCFFLPHTFPGRATRGLVEPLRGLDYYYRPNYVPSPPHYSTPCATVKKAPYNLK